MDNRFTENLRSLEEILASKRDLKERLAEEKAEAKRKASQPPPPVPVKMGERSANPLRPHTFTEIVGQEPAKHLMGAAVAMAKRKHTPLGHTLLTGSAGTGKSTFANATGNEMGVDVYQAGAPVSFELLLSLRDVMHDRDILFIDEIHQQAITERRGKESNTQPEVLFSILEDRVILTPSGPLPYPAITVIGATTDPGRLPEAFLSRFVLRPRLIEYTRLDLAIIASRNAEALGIKPDADGAIAMGDASGGSPRRINNLVQTLELFGSELDVPTVQAVLEANGIAADGLDSQQQEMLRFLYRFGARASRDGTVYQASVGSLATALGLSRDVKAIQLYIEPLLIRRGLVQVFPQGRRLTDLGVQRARQLVTNNQEVAA